MLSKEGAACLSADNSEQEQWIINRNIASITTN